MNKLLYFLAAVGLLVTACQPDTTSERTTQGETTTIAKPSTSSSVTETKSGLSYHIHNKQGAGKKAAFGDFLTLNMQYATMSDSVIFTSFTKPEPLSFRLQESLFRGVLNDGLTQMAAGDSATMIVVADSLYGKRVPKFLKSGDQIKYTVVLDKIQTREEYQKEQEDKRQAQLKKDADVINTYVQKNKLKTITTASGLQYIITKEGANALDIKKTTIQANYTLTALPSNMEIENTKGKLEKLRIQTKGLREGLQLLKEGGQGTIFVPAALAYGNRKRGKIPPNSVLIYDIKELKAIEK